MLLRPHDSEEQNIQTVTTIGLDIAKSVFQVHGIDAAGQVVAVINAIRAHLAEFGIVAPVGRQGVEELLHVVADPNDKRVPKVARACLATLGSQLLGLKKQILTFDRMIMDWYRSNETSKRLHYIPGVGPLLATALAASVADPKVFRSGRNFSAWIGLVPKQHFEANAARCPLLAEADIRL